MGNKKYIERKIGRIKTIVVEIKDMMNYEKDQ